MILQFLLHVAQTGFVVFKTALAILKGLAVATDNFLLLADDLLGSGAGGQIHLGLVDIWVWSRLGSDDDI